MNFTINGKFIGQPTTGVQRFAGELVRALDALLGTDEYAFARARFQLAVPAAHLGAVPDLRHIEIIEVPGRAGHLWEQLRLPLAARGTVLLNLAGSAPACKIGQICTIHDAAVFDRPEAYRRSFVLWYRLLFRLQARLSLRLLTVSEFSRDRLAAALRIEALMLCVVPNGIDHILRDAPKLDVLIRLGLEPGSFLLAVGSANPTKNFPALVAAFTSLPSSIDLKLVITGGVHDSVFAAERLAANERIVLSGRVDDAELRALYEHALALVFPSTYEGFGIPPLEAMCCGCPVAASSVPAVVETCGDAVLYFDPHSVTDIAAALEKISSKPHLRDDLIEKGSRRASAYTWRHSAIQLLAHLEGVGVL